MAKVSVGGAIKYAAIGLCAIFALGLFSQVVKNQKLEKAAVTWDSLVTARDGTIAVLKSQADEARELANSAHKKYLVEHEVRLVLDKRVKVLLADYEEAIAPRDEDLPSACVPLLNEANKCALAVAGLKDDVEAAKAEATTAADEARKRIVEAAKSAERADSLQGLLNKRPKPASKVLIKLPLLSVPFPSVGIGASMILQDCKTKCSVRFVPSVSAHFPFRIPRIF